MINELNAPSTAPSTRGELSHAQKHGRQCYRCPATEDLVPPAHVTEAEMAWAVVACSMHAGGAL